MVNAKQTVRCISVWVSNPHPVEIGGFYVLDLLSVWIDSDGDAYGVIYDLVGKQIGQMKLSHFRTV